MQTMTHALRRRYGHAGGANMGAQEFVAALREHLKLQGRQAHIRVTPSWGISDRGAESVYVNFFNLPEGVGGAGGGAEAENNRASFWVRGFGVAGAPAPSGKVRVELSNSVFTPAHKLRAKSAAPGVIAKYLADHINKIVAEVPPHFTHTSRP